MNEPTRRHRLEGLEPDNLLAFLALLGLLRAIEAARLDWRPRVAWDVEQPPLRPVLVLAEAATCEEISEAAAEGANRLADLYEFPAEDAEIATQKDLNYSAGYARALLSKTAAQDNHERADL